MTMFNRDRLYASNPDTDSSHLNSLAYSVFPSIRSRVAENPSIPLSLLAAFLWDREPEVRSKKELSLTTAYVQIAA